MKDGEKAGRKKLILLINIALVAVIAILLWNKFYTRRLNFHLKYGERPSELLHFVEKYIPENQQIKNISVLFIFNEIPNLEELETIAKLHNKQKKNINTLTFFNKRFKTPSSMNFPYWFLNGLRIGCNYMGKNFNSCYFILLKEQKVSYVDISLKPIEINLIVERNLQPEKSYRNFAKSEKQLTEMLVEESKRGNKNLLNLKKNQFEMIDDFKGYSKIYFVIAGCTSCELKSMISDFKLKNVFDYSNEMIIFPVYASESQLTEILNKEKVDLPIYHDYNDEFNLFSIITGPQNKLIIIENKKAEETK